MLKVYEQYYNHWLVSLLQGRKRWLISTKTFHQQQQQKYWNRCAVWWRRIKEFHDEVGISVWSCQTIFTEDFGGCVTTKFYNFLCKSREFWMITSTDLLHYAETDKDLLKIIITGNELVCEYKTKEQSSVWIEWLILMADQLV